MKENLQEYMRIGTVFEMAFPNCQRTKEYYLDCLKKLTDESFYEAVEVTEIKDDSLRKAVAQFIKDAGMEAAYCAQPVLLKNNLNLNSLDYKKRDKALERMRDCIDEACEVGAKSLSFLAGTYEENTKEEALDCLVDSVEQMCIYAGERLIIEIEIFDYDVDKCSLIGPSVRAVELAERMKEKHNNFFLLPDLSHIPQQHESIEEALRLVLPYIRRTHIGNCVIEKNSSMYGDLHPPFTYPGSSIGVKELTKYMCILLESELLNKKDRPMVSFEINPFIDTEVDRVLKENRMFLEQAWEQIK